MPDQPKYALPPDWQRHPELRTVLAILADGAQRILTRPHEKTADG